MPPSASFHLLQRLQKSFILRYLLCPNEGADLRPLAYWDGGLESRRGHECVSIMFCVVKVEVSASGSSLVQGSPTDCGVSECDREASIIRRPWPTRGCRAIKKKGVQTSVRGFQDFEGFPELMTKKISFNEAHLHYITCLF
jgi:hypothetical protein